MALVKSRAVVLRTYRLGETSSIVVCYTKRFGKVRLVAKGARKGGSRLGGALEPLLVSGVVFYRREGKDLSLVSQAEVEHEFPGLRRDVVRMAYGSAVAELVDKLVPGEESDPPLFGVIVGALHEIDSAPEADLDAALWRFELALACELGYTPEFGRCVLCGNAAGRDARFAPRHGGVVCCDCLATRPGVPVAGAAASAAIAVLAAGEDVVAGSLDAVVRDEIGDTLTDFLGEHAGRSLRLRSIDFLAQVRRVEHLETEPDHHDED